jgi:hypothetical protein
MNTKGKGRIRVSLKKIMSLFELKIHQSGTKNQKKIVENFLVVESGKKWKKYFTFTLQILYKCNYVPFLRRI